MLRRAHPALLLVAGMLVVGCGTTVPVGQRVSVDGGPPQAGSDGLTPGAEAVGAPEAGASGPATGTSVGSTGRGAAPTGPRAGSTSGGGAVGSGAPGGAGVRLAAPGVTAKEIYLGVPVSEGADAVATQLGASQFSSGDTRATAQALIDDINRNGGMGGRRVVPVYHVYRASDSSQTADQKYAEACADYTEDHKVFAVLDTGRSSFIECVTRTAVLVASYDWGFGDADFRRFPYFVDVNTISLERAMRGWVDSLVRQRYFTGWNSVTGQPGTQTEVGILSVDFPAVNRAVEAVLMPALKRAGFAVDPNNYVRLTNGNGLSDAGRTAAEIQNASLRFQQNGVSHTLLFDNAGGVTLLFAQSAANQRYYPRWGITSQNALQGLLEGGNVSARQTNGAVGLGWQPLTDIPSEQAGPTSAYSTDTRRSCLAALRRASITPPSRNAEAIALTYCDKLHFVKHVVDRLPRDGVTRDGFLHVVNGLGGGFTPASIVRSSFSSTKHDGVSQVYDLGFVASCSCMRYAGVGRELS